MPIFNYSTKDVSGKKVDGTVESASSYEVVRLLRGKGLTVISVRAKGKEQTKANQQNVKYGKVKLGQLSVFYRQLATMLDAGVPIVTAIKDLSDQSESINLSAIVTNIASQIEGGNSFSEALKKYPDTFSSLVINMAATGEESGNLPKVMAELASYTEDEVALIKQVQGAIAYPAFIASFFVICVGIVVFILIPKFKDIFASFGATLPPITSMVLGFSEFMIRNILYEIVFVGGAIFSVLAFGKTDKGKHIYANVKIKAPLFGKLFHKVILSRFCRSLATLLDGGVAVIYSLTIASKAAGSILLEDFTQRTISGIEKGSTISDELAKSFLFPKMMVKMIQVGENSGTVPQMLIRLSGFYSEEVKVAVAALTSIIEPLLIVLLGGVVGIVVIAIYFPIFTLASGMK
ncbi:MAG: type II secretion system F family protein [Candidatus Omnitrophica bacterium]|nr:type II secretion system F family protein [Candidatus Omnitrophota bacterium]MBU1047921.1 type II secretion system F family protein [Candidatus Omnitrophota bacterium]MBU1766950.1 type II secretion system F family protein [Candidatus Omnitrophota bacterium]MBU1889796.1 type II secretion system F family protein [Candidatus Omnitrophota bacterium]